MSPLWTCPDCERRFGRRQTHECAPAMSLDEYFSTGPDFERPVFDAVHGLLLGLGDIHVEPVSVGIFLKGEQGGFVELRTMARWVALTFPLTRRLDHPRIARRPIETGRRVVHRVSSAVRRRHAAPE